MNYKLLSFFVTAILLSLSSLPALGAASDQPKFSTAGFYPLPHTGRQAYSMNPAWRFYKGHVAGADRPDFDDRSWEAVSLPHGIENLPSEASGCVNYQGEVWYRKHFRPLEEWKGKKLFLHFEAIMGRSKVWVNGQLVKEHAGGFLPVIADVSRLLKWGEENVITVMADNSNDPTYPPGKDQNVLDFTYAGGIYRDCWMIAHEKVYITDPNVENEVAGGGLFVSYDHVSENSSDVLVKLQVRNSSAKDFKGNVVFCLVDREGKTVKTMKLPLAVSQGRAVDLSAKTVVRNPHLWSPDDPYLYQLRVYMKDTKGRIVDGYYQRVGIRSIEFKGKDGFWLNGKPYPEPLMGANRHQEFAVIGNALPNSLHWRDAKKLRDAGLRVIRNAHYPQDPAFMDACDELGLFVIVNTPGWQFWNDAPSFAAGVYSDIRNIVRRDRNHPSVWLYEPILNETHYPADFAKRVHDIVHEEYPYPYCYAASDASARGHECFKVQFVHVPTEDSIPDYSKADPTVTYFTREWGDNVDDWNSHNSPSRASRSWGEVPMLVQAQGYAKPDYPYICYDAFYRATRQFVGGCLWHSFDHQRGYHPDPFYGGIMDNYRQPKYAYYMFCAQRPPYQNEHLIADSGPMVYIANAMTPFSPSDVTVYSNCDEVRLTRGIDGKTYTYRKDKHAVGMPSPVITFKDVWKVMDDKQASRDGHQDKSYLLAEGLMDGKVVATDTVRPARRPTHLRLFVDDGGVQLKADGSDIVTVVAEVTDDRGTVKRLNNEQIRFEVSGPGRLVADEKSFTNPRAVQWGTAPVLVQSSVVPGTIKVTASVVWQGEETPVSAEIEIPTVRPDHPLVFNKEEANAILSYVTPIPNMGMQAKKNKASRLKDVEKQQAEFEK